MKPITLLVTLLDSEEDISLLRRMGIAENMLGSDKEVAELFNGLCKGVTVDDVFEGLIPKVSQHYRNKYKVQFRTVFIVALENRGFGGSYTWIVV